MTKDKDSNYWKDKINNRTRYQPEQFKGKVRSRGEVKSSTKNTSNKASASKWAQKLKSESKGKSQSWVSKINAERQIKQDSRKQVSLTKMRSRIQHSKKNAQIKGIQAFSKPAPNKSQKVGKLITPKLSRRIAQPVAHKRAVNLAKKRQELIKSSSAGNKQVPNGITKLQNFAQRNQPVKVQENQKTNSSKGIQAFKNLASKNPIVANKGREVKRVQQPVVRRGR